VKVHFPPTPDTTLFRQKQLNEGIKLRKKEINLKINLYESMQGIEKLQPKTEMNDKKG